jgi:hypothetical protein
MIDLVYCCIDKVYRLGPVYDKTMSVQGKVIGQEVFAGTVVAITTVVV